MTKKLPGNFGLKTAFADTDRVLGYRSGGNAATWSRTNLGTQVLQPLVIPVSTEAELLDAVDVAQRGDSSLHVGSVIELPYGEITLTDTLYLSPRQLFTLRGKGSGASTLRFQGGNDEVAIYGGRLDRCTFEGFTLVNDGTGGVGIKLATVMPVDADNGGTQVGVQAFHGVSAETRNVLVAGTKADLSAGVTPTECTCKDVHVDGFERGFSVDSLGMDTNNEFHKFYRCEARNCTDGGFYIYGSQAHRIQFFGCTTRSCLRGLYSDRGHYWFWRQGRSFDNTTDFYVGGGGFSFVFLIEGHYSWGSAMLGDTSAADVWGGTFSSTGAGNYMTIRQVYWNGEPASEEEFVWFTEFDPMAMEGVHIETRNGKPCRMQIGPVGRYAMSFGQTSIADDDRTQEPPVRRGLLGDTTPPDTYGDYAVVGGVTEGFHGIGADDVATDNDTGRQTVNLAGKTTTLTANQFETFSWVSDLGLLAPTSNSYTPSFSIAWDFQLSTSLPTSDVFMFRVGSDIETSVFESGGETKIKLIVDAVSKNNSGSPLLSSGVTYRAVLSWNRDQERNYPAIFKVGRGADGFITLLETSFNSEHTYSAPNIMYFSSASSQFAGTYSNVHTWQRALTPAEVEAEDVGGAVSLRKELLGV